MHLSDIKWAASGHGRAATVYAAGDRVFDLYQDRPSYLLIQVCEFPVFDAGGEARTMTYYFGGEDSIARFLADKCATPEDQQYSQVA